MKKILLLVLLCCFALTGYAQKSAKTTDMDNAGDKGSSLNKKLPKIKSRDRFLMELTHDNWLHDMDSLGVKTKWYSRGFNMLMMWDVPLLKSGAISIAPGFGLVNTNVFTNSLIHWGADDRTEFSVIPDTLDYSKSKLAVSSLEVPVELRFRTLPKKGKSFKLAIGGRVGYVISAHTKYKGDDYRTQFASPNTVKIKEAPVANINRLKYGVTARIGIGNFNLLAYYSLSKLFDTSKAPEITPFSIGIGLNSF